LATEDPTRQAPKKPIKDSVSNLVGLSSVLDLTFRLVGGVFVGGVMGYLLDRWLHTDPIFTLILGALGFVAGITTVVRRLSQQEKREEKERDGG
jgi:F0F1-type ATP synthase assembly protein I